MATNEPASIKESSIAVRVDQTTQCSLVLRHMPSLDSIRGLAVLMVVLFHGLGSFNWFGALGTYWGSLASEIVGVGRYGVDLFFVLSGFLITGILLKTSHRTDFYRNFYIRRALRILPIYLLLLVVLRLWHVVDSRFTLAAVLFLANFARLFGAPSSEYGPLWSLAVEEHFYLLWPTCVRRFQPRSLYRVLLAVIVAEPLLRLLALHINSGMDIHFKTPFILDFLAYGALTALLVNDEMLHAGNARQIGVWLLFAGGLLTGTMVWLSAFHRLPMLAALEDLPPVWAACGLLLRGLSMDHTRFHATGKNTANGFLPFFGYISYGLYLIHLLVYEKVGGLIRQHSAPTAPNHFGFFLSGVLFCIAVATGIAYLSRRYFEGPILDLKNKWQDRFAQPTAPPPASVSASAG